MLSIQFSGFVYQFVGKDVYIELFSVLVDFDVSHDTCERPRY